MLKELKTPFFTVLFIFVGLFLFVKIFGPLPFSVNTVTTTKDSSFTAEGKGEVTAIPETALFSFGVTKEATNVSTAKDQVNQIMNQIADDLKTLGVNAKDIKTTNYSVNPNYDYTQNGRQILRGYTVNADIQVRLKPIEQANKAVDIVTKDGATNVGGIQFVFDEAKQKELEEQARREAISNAKQKAQNLAQAAGIKLGRIINVQESAGYQPPVAYLMKESARGGDSSATTDLNPGENKVSITVTISYEIF